MPIDYEIHQLGHDSKFAAFVVEYEKNASGTITYVTSWLYTPSDIKHLMATHTAPVKVHGSQAWWQDIMQPLQATSALVVADIDNEKFAKFAGDLRKLAG